MSHGNWKPWTPGRVQPVDLKTKLSKSVTHCWFILFGEWNATLPGLILNSCGRPLCLIQTLNCPLDDTHVPGVGGFCCKAVDVNCVLFNPYSNRRGPPLFNPWPIIIYNRAHAVILLLRALLLPFKHWGGGINIAVLSQFKPGNGRQSYVHDLSNPTNSPTISGTCRCGKYGWHIYPGCPCLIFSVFLRELRLSVYVTVVD